MKKLLLALLVIPFLNVGCKHGDDTEIVSRHDTLTTGMWRMVSFAATVKWPITGSDSTINLYSSFDTCAQDDRYIFRTDGKMTNDQGTNKCYISEPQQMDGGTWSLNAAMDTLDMKDGTFPGKFRIASFSNTQMTLEKDTTYLVFQGRLRATLIHE